MVVTHIGSNSGQQAANTTSITLTLPTHQSGDFGIVFGHADESGAIAVLNVATAGWTELYQNNDTTDRDRVCACWYKIFTSGAETDPVMSIDISEEHSSILHVFRGVDNIQPFDYPGAHYTLKQTANNTTTPDIAQITTFYDNACIVLHCAMTHDDLDANGPPATYTAGETTATGRTTDHRQGTSAYKLNVGVAGTYLSTTTWNHTTTGGATGGTSSYSVALRELQPIHLVTISDNQIEWNQVNLIVTGDGFEATQNAGTVEFWDDVSGTTQVAQSIDSWSDSSIQFDATQGSLSNNSIVYAVVTNNTGNVSDQIKCKVGLLSYENEIDFMYPDHYWTFNNTTNDTGDTGPTLNATGGVGGTSFVATPISESSTHSLLFNSVTDAIETSADSPNMNITINSNERTVHGWIRLGSIQQSLGAIWKEGGGVQNLAFLVGFGNVLLAQHANNTANDNVQSWSDYRLTIGRPYHICMRYSYLDTPKEFNLYIDGIEQTVAVGNPMDSFFNSHSGDIVWGDPDTNLETGGTDIAYAGMENCLISHWASWSDNSGHVNAGGLDPVTEIRDRLFRRGALPKYTISTATEATMQASLNSQLANSEVEDWPLGIRVESVTGDGDLELIADNITFSGRTTDHLEWRGKTGDTLTWVLENGSEIDSYKAFGPSGGLINIVYAPAITITAKDASTGTIIENTRVKILADAGGDLPFNDSVSITLSGSTATATHTAHNLRTGLMIAIAGATQKEYNGYHTITVTAANTYTYTVSGSPVSPATGAITATSVLINALTNVSGQVTVNHRYTSDQPISGVGRKSSSSPYYKEGALSGTITNIGFFGTIFLVSDE